jgi:hypothetical protein
MDRNLKEEIEKDLAFLKEMRDTLSEIQGDVVSVSHLDTLIFDWQAELVNLYNEKFGKTNKTEEIEVNDLDDIESKLLKQMVSTTYIIAEDGFEQPYRAYLL